MRSVAECLSLPPDTFEKFKGSMDRLKFIKYPQAPPESQGVGPHKDSTGLFTFLSQDDTGGLQVLNKNGAWIDAPPIEGSLVVNIQQGFEAITGGVCAATTHRVVVSVSHRLLTPPLIDRRRPPAKPDIAFRSSSACGWTSLSTSSRTWQRISSAVSLHQMTAKRGRLTCRANSCRRCTPA